MYSFKRSSKNSKGNGMKRVLQPKEKYYSLMRNCILKPFSKYIEIPVWCKEETKKWHRNLFEQIQEDIKKALITVY